MMDTCDPSAHTYDDSSDRSESSNFDSSNNHQIYNYSPNLDPKPLTGLNLSICRKTDSNITRNKDVRDTHLDIRDSHGLGHGPGSGQKYLPTNYSQFDDFNSRDLSLIKSKNLTFLERVGHNTNELNLEPTAVESLSLCINRDLDKDSVYSNLSKTRRQQKLMGIERFNGNMDREFKEYGLTKNYNLMKEFNFMNEHNHHHRDGIVNLASERLGNVGLLTGNRIMESSEFRNPSLGPVQRTSPNVEANISNIAVDGRRHLLNSIDLTQNISALPNRLQVNIHQQQPQQQQQTTSFTIDAILGKNNQREKYQRCSTTMRKNSRQECKYFV